MNILLFSIRIISTELKASINSADNLANSLFDKSISWSSFDFAKTLGSMLESELFDRLRVLSVKAVLRKSEKDQ